jgi:hypothetical protein
VAQDLVGTRVVGAFGDHVQAVELVHLHLGTGRAHVAGEQPGVDHGITGHGLMIPPVTPGRKVRLPVRRLCRLSRFGRLVGHPRAILVRTLAQVARELRRRGGTGP